MQRWCQIIGWTLLSFLLLSGGAMSYFIATQHPFWTEHPLRQHYIPIGHAHAGLLGIIMLLYGLYLDKVNLSQQARNWAAALYIIGTLLLPGGFLMGAIKPGLTTPSREFLLTPIGGLLIGVSFITMAVGMFRTRKA